MAIIRPENQVSVTFSQPDPETEAVVLQCETFSSANRDFLAQLRGFCDSVLHAYLSKIADTAEKRNYLHILYTTAITLRLPMDSRSLEAFLNDITQILDLYPPTFQPCSDPHVLLHATWEWDILTQANYLRDFLGNPERGKLFYYDPELWSAVVAARYMRYLMTTSNLR